MFLLPPLTFREWLRLFRRMALAAILDEEASHVSLD